MPRRARGGPRCTSAWRRTPAASSGAPTARRTGTGHGTARGSRWTWARVRSRGTWRSWVRPAIDAVPDAPLPQHCASSQPGSLIHREPQDLANGHHRHTMPGPVDNRAAQHRPGQLPSRRGRAGNVSHAHGMKAATGGRARRALPRRCRQACGPAGAAAKHGHLSVAQAYRCKLAWQVVAQHPREPCGPRARHLDQVIEAAAADQRGVEVVEVVASPHHDDLLEYPVPSGAPRKPPITSQSWLTLLPEAFSREPSASTPCG